MYGPLVGEVQDRIIRPVGRWQSQAGRRNGWLFFSPRKVASEILEKKGCA